MTMSQKLSRMRRVMLAITEEEADALMSILLDTRPTTEVPEAVAEALLCRVADAQRKSARLNAPTTPVRTIRRRARIARRKPE